LTGRATTQVMSKSRAVFLDRDGVLNRTEVRDGRPYPPRTLAGLEILPGVAEACALLRQYGFLLIVVTNQPDVGRGQQSQRLVEAMHEVLLERLPLHRIEVCYAAGFTVCKDRKPAPGMLLRAAAEFGIDLNRSFMIGDRWRDIDCGHAAGCTTVLIDYGYQEALHAEPAYRAASLLEAAHWIIGQEASSPW
jgi:D-glycero-D-manno-heptose 1,7-bisphosphate phosphatase